MPKVYGLPMYPRLRPVTVWAGGRITETDVLTLDEAAKMASKHAGTEITVQDFLRAAGRGEILLRAVLNRTVVMQPCCVGDTENRIPQTGIQTLPLEACQALANIGSAKWRHIDCFEIVEELAGQLCRYERWRLSDDEPCMDTTIGDCRIIGLDVHALADAYKCADIDNLDPQSGNTQKNEFEKFIPKLQMQENAIIEQIVKLGHSPLNLPDRIAGKHGVKSEVRKILLLQPALFTTASFNKAWERLRSSSAIVGG